MPSHCLCTVRPALVKRCRAVQMAGLAGVQGTVFWPPCAPSCPPFHRPPGAMDADTKADSEANFWLSLVSLSRGLSITGSTAVITACGCMLHLVAPLQVESRYD